MTLFDECKLALKDDFNLICDEEKKCVMDRFYFYFLEKKEEFNFQDYSFEEMYIFSKMEPVYVLCDSSNIPLFTSNWKLIIDNIYDVVCLSTKVFFLDDEKLMMTLFPEDKVRVIYKR
ncbi:hypothetical protein ACNO7P_10480 [Bisgaard Taxon 45]